MNAYHDRTRSLGEDRVDDIRAGLDALAARAEAIRKQWRYLRLQTKRRPGIARKPARQVIRFARIGEGNASQMLDSAIECLVALGRGEIKRCTAALSDYGRRQQYNAAIDRLVAITILGAAGPVPRRHRRRRHHDA